MAKETLTVLQSPIAEHLHFKFIEKIEQSQEGHISSPERYNGFMEQDYLNEYLREGFLST